MDAKLEGFFVYDWEAQFRELESTNASWIRSGELRPLEDIDEGIERMPAALISLYEGSNAGVRMVRVDPGADGGA